MRKYYRERFEAQQRITGKLASTIETNEILEMLREETRNLVLSSMEVCILLLDPDAKKYTRPPPPFPANPAGNSLWILQWKGSGKAYFFLADFLWLLPRAFHSACEKGCWTAEGRGGFSKTCFLPVKGPLLS